MVQLGLTLEGVDTAVDLDEWKAELASHEDFFAKLGDHMPEVLALQRKMFVVRIDTLKKRRWGGRNTS